MNSVKTVDEYINNAPTKIRGELIRLRRAIKDTAPEAEEKMSYKMPYYHYKGRLLYFSAFNDHIRLYIPPPVINRHKKELKDYKTATSAIWFPPGKKLPLTLIKKLIRSRMKINERMELKNMRS